MGNETSVPALVRTTSSEKSVLQAQLQWAIAQTARVNFSQSLINQSIHAPLIVPSIQQASGNHSSPPSLYNHLTYSVDLLCTNIDDLLNNKEMSQRGLQPKEARINGYQIINDFVQSNNQIPALISQKIATLGLHNQALDEPISFSEFLVDDSEESLVDRALIGSRFVLLQSVNQSINQSLMYALTLVEQKAYLNKRLSVSQDYHEDHVFATNQSIDQTLNHLLPILTTARLAFVMLYRDFRLQSFKSIINEWVRVLTGLQSTWSHGPSYRGPCQSISQTIGQSNNHSFDPVVDQLMSKVGDKQQLIGISLTTPNQTHLAPDCPPPRTSGNLNKLFDPAHFIDRLIEQLHVKAQLVDMALRHNEMEAVNVAANHLPNHSINYSRIIVPDDRLFVIPPADIKRAHRRVVSQLALNRRHTVNASEVRMAVTNMRNRLYTLTNAMIQLGDVKGNRSSPVSSEQFDKVAHEAQAEVLGLRSIFDLFMPQTVLELTKTLGAASDQIVQQQLNHLKSNLIAMSPFSRTQLTLSPPPIPQRASRPSLSVKLANDHPTIEAVPVKSRPSVPVPESSTSFQPPSTSPQTSLSSVGQTYDSPTPSSQVSVDDVVNASGSPQSLSSSSAPAAGDPSVTGLSLSSKNLTESFDDQTVEPGAAAPLPIAQPVAQPAAVAVVNNDQTKPERRHRRSPSFGLLAQETYGVDLTKLEEQVPRDTPEFEQSVHHQLDTLRHVGIKLTAPDAKEYWWKKVFVQEHNASSPTSPESQRAQSTLSPQSVSSQQVPPPIPAKPMQRMPPPIPNNDDSPGTPAGDSQVFVSSLPQSGSDPALNKQLPKEQKEKSGLRLSRRRASETSTPIFTSTLASLLPPRRFDQSVESPDSAVNIRTEEMSPISPNVSSAPLRTSPTNSPPSGLRSIIKKGGSPDGRRRVTFAPDVRSPHHGLSSFELYNREHGGDYRTYGSDDDSSRLRARGMTRNRDVTAKYLREGDVLKRASVTVGPSSREFRAEPHYV